MVDFCFFFCSLYFFFFCCRPHASTQDSLSHIDGSQLTNRQNYVNLLEELYTIRI